MAKLYYGDSNNTATEINVGGQGLEYWTEKRVQESFGHFDYYLFDNDIGTSEENKAKIKSSGGTLSLECGRLEGAPPYYPQIKIDPYGVYITDQNNDSYHVDGNVLTLKLDEFNRCRAEWHTPDVTKTYVDSNFPMSPTIRNIQVVSALPASPDASTLYLIQG